MNVFVAAAVNESIPATSALVGHSVRKLLHVLLSGFYRHGRSQELLFIVPKYLMRFSLRLGYETKAIGTFSTDLPKHLKVTVFVVRTFVPATPPFIGVSRVINVSRLC